MEVLRHIDKMICGVLIMVTAWYALVGFERLKSLRGDHANEVEQAFVLVQETGKNVIAPPERDAALYSGVPMRRWDRVPKATDFTTRHFYPRLEVRSRRGGGDP